MAPDILSTNPTDNHQPTVREKQPAEADRSPRVPSGASLPPDPFDPARFRLSQDFAAAAGVKPVITTVAARKPNRHEFVRVRSGPEWRFEAGTFIDKADREVYLVPPELFDVLHGDVTPTALLLTVSRHSPVPFFWPCPLPGQDGRSNRWHESALAAAAEAESQWVRVVADMSAGCYVPHVAIANLSEPDWPDLSLDALLRLAFRGRILDTPDHPVLRRLRGEA